MKNKVELLNIIDMLRQLDLQKNSIDDIQNVLLFIAEKLEDLVEAIQ